MNRNRDEKDKIQLKIKHKIRRLDKIQVKKKVIKINKLNFYKYNEKNT